MMASVMPPVMPSVLDERRNAESRERITARLRSADKAGKQAQRTKPVLPKFVEGTEEKTACFVARAEALSCQFLAAEKTAKKTEGKTEGKTKVKAVDEKNIGKTLKTFFEERLEEERLEKSSTKKTLPLLLLDSSEKFFGEHLDILKSLEGCCRTREVREGVEGADFLDTPFPAFSLQHAVCAIAETGTLVFANRTRAQAILTFLPTTHIVLLAEKDIEGSLEQAFARVPYPPKQASTQASTQASKSGLWACHCVSGPSRTADIEQTLHMGAHGPKELFILLYR